MISYKNMPKGVLQLNLVQVFSTVGYAILMGLLNFYLTRNGGMSKTEANTLTASFFALNFLLHFVGGALGGKYFSFRGLFCFSLVLQIIGMLMIAIPSQNFILLGMAFFITGSGLNVSCINMMLTQLFEAKDKRRRVAFSINYSAMNVGFFLSFIFAGMIQEGNSYYIAFYAAVACLIISFCIHILNLKNVKDKDTHFHNVFSKQGHRFFVAPFIIIACLIMSLYLMYHPEIAMVIVYLTFFILLAYLLIFAFMQKPMYKKQILSFLVLTSACMIFACVQGMQTGALQNFVEDNTTKTLLGFSMQPATVNSFETLGVIIFGLLLASNMSKY